MQDKVGEAFESGVNAAWAVPTYFEAGIKWGAAALFAFFGVLLGLLLARGIIKQLRD